MSPLRRPTPSPRAPSRVTRSKHAARRNYDRRARHYERLEGFFEAPLRDAGVARLAPTAGEQILEIGYGTGAVAVQLARAVGHHGHLDGIDISAEMRRVARANLRHEGLDDREELAVGDALELPYASGRFDAVFTSFTLELFDTPELPRVIEECRRVLRPGGRIVVVGLALPERPTLAVRIYEVAHRLLPVLVDCRPIPIATLLQEGGFTTIVTEHRSLLGLPVDIVVGRTETDAATRPA